MEEGSFYPKSLFMVVLRSQHIVCLLVSCLCANQHDETTRPLPLLPACQETCIADPGAPARACVRARAYACARARLAAAKAAALLGGYGGLQQLEVRHLG